MKILSKLIQGSLLIFLLFLFQDCDKKKNSVSENETTIKVKAGEFDINIEKKGFRYDFRKKDGQLIAPAHPVSGLLMGRSGGKLADVTTTELSKRSNGLLEFDVVFSDRSSARVTLELVQNGVRLSVNPEEVGDYDIVLRTGPLGPAYGLADHAAFGEGSENLELNNFVRDPFDPERRSNHRMISNFTIFPQQGLAEVNIEPGEKLVRITNEENAQG